MYEFSYSDYTVFHVHVEKEKRSSQNKRKRKRKEISGKSQNFIELLPSAQSSSPNENFVSIENFVSTFSRNALFYMKT